MNKLYILLVVIAILLSACSNKEIFSDVEKLEENQIIINDSEENIIENKVQNDFFQSGKNEKNYEGYFEFLEVFNENVTINYEQIFEEKSFIVYKVTINGVENVPSDRLSLGYFCVFSDCIYRLETIDEVNEYMDSGDIPENATILFRTTPLEDTLEQGEKGLHQYIEVNEDEVEYHAYNNLVETGYYETFIWKREQGLILYQSGFGAGRESILLKHIVY